MLLGTISTCWIVTLINFPLSSKMNIYPTGRFDTKNIKETSEEHLMGALKKHVNHTGAYRKKKMHQIFFFSSNTTFSTDVLQHEYIIYIYFIHTFSKLDQISITGCYKVNFYDCNSLAFCPCVSQVLFLRG